MSNISFRVAVLISALCVAGSLLAISKQLSKAFRINIVRAMTNHSEKGDEDIEHDIRTSLPVGTARSTVEAYLGKHRMDFSFQAPSHTIYAIARKLNGNNMLVSKSLQIQFHFDQASRLTSVSTKVTYTGP